MLPEPTFKFTIPSIHDDIALDCRVYNPPHSVLNSVEATWNPQGAIIAHPYAPLGGSYDDEVVLSAAAEFSKQGFVVGTFNFRQASTIGASRSKGKTSWQAKPELDDYISFVGFFVHYVEDLRAARPYTHSYVNADTTLSPIPSACGPAVDPSAVGSQGMILVIGGYSYGSLIATHLPTTDRILERFEMVSKGTAEAEIRLRAISLSAQWKKDARCYREGQYARESGSHEKLKTSTRAMGIAIGGDESDPGTRRTSHEGRRSMDAVRRSMDRSRMKLGLRQHSHNSEMSERAIIEESLAAVKVLLPQTHYLLISPLLPPISMFATMFSKRLPRYEDKLIQNPTFAVYGDDDFFTSQSKLRRWAEGLKAKPESRFRSQEVPGAGHFWREEGSDRQMRRGIRQWLQDVSNQHLSCQ